MNDVRSTNDDTRDIPPYPQESLLLDVVAEIAATAEIAIGPGDDLPVARIISTSPGLAQFAGAAALALPHATVTCTYLDAYRAGLASDYWHDRPPNFVIECAADLAFDTCDVVAFPFSAHGEAELTRDLLQAGHDRLRLGGKLYATTDRREDSWLGEQLRKIFPALKRREQSAGVLYVATKTEPLKKRKDFSCEFAFRDRGRLIRAWSRPGVFSHRHIDPGARHLIEEMQIDAGARVLDIGCGAGVVALAAACRAEESAVHAVDSNARAVECTARGAELNGLANITTELNAEGNYAGAGSFDLALANPPYYAGFRIARHFLTAARDSLRPGGTILLVTKHPAWYAENMPRWFDELSHRERKGYHLFHALRPADA